MSNKMKVVTISDMPLVASGVATQTKYIIEGLLRTGKYQIRALGGAIQHQDQRPIKMTEYGDDLIIYPVNGYGDPTIIREVLDYEKPDAIWFMTDPRFYGWLYEMSDEIRDRGVPLVYYHVWDAEPTPKYNKLFYESCDYVGCISKLTYKILCDLGLSDRSSYIPHAVNTDIFKPLSKEEILKERIQHFGETRKNSFMIFYNSRNARRKMTSDVVKCFKQFADKVGDKDGEKAFLIMHTDPHDPEGANLYAVCEMLGIKNSQIVFSKDKLEPEIMNKLYNMCDITISLSNNEGWGLSMTESLSCGVPIVCNYTGGMKDQVLDENKFEYGKALLPATKSLTGSQQIPYIFDERNADEDVLEALMQMYEMSDKDYDELSKKCRDRAVRDFKVERMVSQWDVALETVIKKFKAEGYKDRIRMVEV